MNSTEEPLPEPEAYAFADFGDRVFARIVDGFLMSCILLVTWFAAGVFVWFILPVPAAAIILVMLAVALYEVYPTAQRGCAVGKKTVEVNVIRWSAFNDAATPQPPFPSYGESLIRWLVPHGMLFAGAGTSVWLWHLADLRSADLNPLVWFIGPVGWVLIYLTSLLDKNGRGWHDKIAGTVVVKAPHSNPSEK